jgi:hypothetical protein
VLRVETALAFAFDTKLERNPSQANPKSIFERERGIESEVGERTLIVRVHFHFFRVGGGHCVTFVDAAKLAQPD